MKPHAAAHRQPRHRAHPPTELHAQVVPERNGTAGATTDDEHRLGVLGGSSLQDVDYGPDHWALGLGIGRCSVFWRRCWPRRHVRGPEPIRWIPSGPRTSAPPPKSQPEKRDSVQSPAISALFRAQTNVRPVTDNPCSRHDIEFRLSYHTGHTQRHAAPRATGQPFTPRMKTTCPCPAAPLPELSLCCPPESGRA